MKIRATLDLDETWWGWDDATIAEMVRVELKAAIKQEIRKSIRGNKDFKKLINDYQKKVLKLEQENFKKLFEKIEESA